MSQSDVFDWLVNRRSSGDDSYFLPKEIEKELIKQGKVRGGTGATRGDCFRLWQNGNGCLEMKDYDLKNRTNWLRAFRVKKKYVKVMDHEQSQE